jgi:hypothetical protein
MDGQHHELHNIVLRIELEQVVELDNELQIIMRFT